MCLAPETQVCTIKHVDTQLGMVAHFVLALEAEAGRPLSFEASLVYSRELHSSQGCI